MKNQVKTFRLFVRPDPESQRIADKIRALNAKTSFPLAESENGDLIIAIGGDGTFIESVTSTHFSKKKIYTGIHTGTLGFLQDLCENDILSLIQYIHFEKEIKTRKVYTAFVKVFLKDGNTQEFFALNEILQNVTGSGIVIATSTGDTAFSLNANGAIDFSNNFQLVCTLSAPIRNAAYERFITNPIICSKIDLVLKPTKNISIIIDGRKKDIDSKLVEKVEVSMVDDSNHINKLDIMSYSKVGVIRNKILGY